MRMWVGSFRFRVGRCRDGGAIRRASVAHRDAFLGLLESQCKAKCRATRRLLLLVDIVSLLALFYRRDALR